MANPIAYELRFSDLNKCSEWQNEDLLLTRISDSEPDKTLPIIKASVAYCAERASLHKGSRFVVNNIGYVVFFKTIVPWNELTREKRVALNRMIGIGVKIDSGPPSCSTILSELEIARYFRM